MIAVICGFSLQVGKQFLSYDHLQPFCWILKYEAFAVHADHYFHNLMINRKFARFGFTSQWAAFGPQICPANLYRILLKGWTRSRMADKCGVWLQTDTFCDLTSTS